jgi:uncharacterized protein involved in exopolysaccharide biosynthesis
MNATDHAVEPARPNELIKLVLKLWTGRWWIIGSVLVVTGLSALIAFTTQPVFRASTLLTAADTHRQGMGAPLGGALGSLGGLASLAGVNVGGVDATIEEALAVLKSREFTEEFIRRHNLLPVLYPGTWNEKGEWTGDATEKPTVTRAYKFFDRNVRAVDRDKKTGLVVLTIDWTDKARAAEWANSLVAQLNEEMRQRAIRQAEASLGFLEKELSATTVVETRQAISSLIEAQIRQRMMANVSQEYVFRVIDRAMTPDVSDKVRPKRLLMLVIGGLLGGALGIVLLLMRDFFKALRAA